MSLRPLRVALPVVRTLTPRASSFALTVSVSAPDVSACAGGASTREREQRAGPALHRAATAIVNEPQLLPAG